MKPRLTVLFSLCILSAVLGILVPPVRVQGQRADYKTYIPFVQMPEQHGIPRFEAPDSATVIKGGSASYTFSLFNDGPVSDEFYLSDQSDPTKILPGVTMEFYNQQEFLHPGNATSMYVTIRTSLSASSGTDTRVLRARAGSPDSPIFADVTITTVVTSPTPTSPTDIRNGTFEDGRVEWSEYAEDDDVQLIQRSPNAHGGQWQAKLLTRPNDYAELFQETFLTDTTNRLAVSYWYKIESDDPQCSNAEGPDRIADYGGLVVGTPVSPSFPDIRPLCGETDTNGQWVHRVVDISQFVNQKVTISFTALSNENGVSHFYIDDVELVALP